MEIIGYAIVFGLVLVVGGYTIFLFMVLVGAIAGAPFIPTNKKTTKKMVEAVGIKEGDVVYDLGSGDGRLIFEAADKGAQAYGIEIGRFNHLYARLKQKALSKKGNLIRANLFKVDLSDADVVFIYLLPKLMDKVEKKLEQELKPGTRVVSHGFKFSKREPTKHISRDDGAGAVYIYEF